MSKKESLIITFLDKFSSSGFIIWGWLLILKKINFDLKIDTNVLFFIFLIAGFKRNFSILNTIFLISKALSEKKQLLSLKGLKELYWSVKSKNFNKSVGDFKKYKPIILVFLFIINFFLFLNVFLGELLQFSKRYFNYLLVVSIIIFDIFLYQVNFDWYFLLVFFNWLLIVVRRQQKSDRTFLVAVFLLFLAMILVTFRKDLMAEKSSVWAFLFLSFGLIQSLVEDYKGEL